MIQKSIGNANKKTKKVVDNNVENKKVDAAIEFLERFSGLKNLYIKNKQELKESDDKKRKQ